MVSCNPLSIVCRFLDTLDLETLVLACLDYIHFRPLDYLSNSSIPYVFIIILIMNRLC